MNPKFKYIPLAKRKQSAPVSKKLARFTVLCSPELFQALTEKANEIESSKTQLVLTALFKTYPDIRKRRDEIREEGR